MSDLRDQTWVIEAGASASNGIRLGELHLVGIDWDTALTGPNFALEVNDTDDAASYRALDWECGAAFALTPTAGRSTGLDPRRCYGWQWARLVSSGVEAGDRTITPKLRSIRG